MYRLKLLIANNFRLLFAYNADLIRDLTSFGSLRTFTESVVIFRCFPNKPPFNKRSKQILGLKRKFKIPLQLVKM